MHFLHYFMLRVLLSKLSKYLALLYMYVSNIASNTIHSKYLTEFLRVSNDTALQFCSFH